MGRPRDVGVYRKENGVWEYRFITTVNGKQIQRKGNVLYLFSQTNLNLSNSTYKRGVRYEV